MASPQLVRSAFHEELPLVETGEFTATCSIADLGVDPELSAALTEAGPLCFLDFEATGLSTETDDRDVATGLRDLVSLVF